MRSRSFLRFVACASAAPLLFACASLPRTIEIPQSRLEAALARRFPYETHLGDLVVARASDPRLALLPDSNRLQLAFTLEAADRIVHRAVRGRCAASFSVRYEPSDMTLRLANVRVESIELQGLRPLRRQLEPVAARVGEQLAEGAVLHTFRPEDLARANGYAPGAIRVTATGVSIELVAPR